MPETEVDRPADNPYVEDPPTDFDPVEELSESEAREQADQLRAAIRYHDHRYYVEADPLIADRTYDRLFERLRDLEDAFDLDREDSPTRRVGGEPVEAFDAVEHVAPMLSIDQSGEADEVRAFDERVRRDLAEAGIDDLRYVCEPKFDGVSIEVVYEDGRYERAVTRGDGREGDDVTRNVRTIASVPGRLRGDPPEFLAVRGEIYMPRDAFQQYNKERVQRGDEPFANPRNATAGTVRQQDPSVVADRPLQVFFFDVLESSDPFGSQWAALSALPEFGLRVTDRIERTDAVATDADAGRGSTGANDADDAADDVGAEDAPDDAGVDDAPGDAADDTAAESSPAIETAIDYRDRLLADRDDLDFEVDGAVIKVDAREARELLGATERHYRWAFAYKFPARTEETTVREIAVQVGRTGRLTPVALLDPVDVGGVTVSRASLHNPDRIAELGVGVGDRVRVERAGDVIPQVAEVIEADADGHFEFPEECPVCGSPVERDGPIARCTGGLACDAQLRRSIEHYASDDGLDVEGLGEESVRQLVAEGLLDGLADLYELDVADLAALEGWGQRSAGKLIDEIERTREPPLADFLAALGIPDVGTATARGLAREFGTFADLRAAAEDGDREALRRVDDVGPEVADSVVAFVDNERNRTELEALLEHVDPQRHEGTGGDELDGLTFVFTGSLDGYTRDEAQEVVERHGGSATSSVSGNTDYLVVGSDPGDRKRAAADEAGVPTIDEEGFEELLAERGVEV